MINKTAFPTIYTPYPSIYQKRCISCQTPVQYKYPAKKRKYRDFVGNFEEVRYLYCCTNKVCSLFAKVYNPAPIYALPGKRYTLSVWKWISNESVKFNQNAAQISKRIEQEFGIFISDNTIRDYIDEINIYLAGKIDEKTRELVSKNGTIILSMDGQEPDEGSESLWLFVDLITGRVLKVQLLRSADHLTLHKIVEEILNTYKVTLGGILSDKQGSIVKMREEFYPQVPQQYCQFHFLQNIWNQLEVKDSHLQKELSSAINHLYIVTVSKTEERKLDQDDYVNLREHFSEVESDLRKLIKSRNKKFDAIRGTQTYQRIDKYLKEIDETWQNQDQNHRITKILKKTSEKLHEVLNENEESYKDCCELFGIFQEIRDILNTEYKFKKEHQHALSEYFKELWNSIKEKTKFENRDDIRVILPSANALSINIKEEWIRLYDSYKGGLFSYYDFTVKERTNSKMEQAFGQEKMRLYSRLGKYNIGREVRVRGEFALKQYYIEKDEINGYLDAVEGSYDRESVQKGLEELAKRQQKESNEWQNKIIGKNALLRLYDSENKEKKRT